MIKKTLIISLPDEFAHLGAKRLTKAWSFLKNKQKFKVLLNKGTKVIYMKNNYAKKLLMTRSKTKYELYHWRVNTKRK